MSYLRVKDINMHYESCGTGEPILFIHGSGACWRMWEPQIGAFSPIYQMIMVDIRGHGETDRHFPKNKYSIPLIVEDIKGFILALGLKRVHIAGVSQGAVIAQMAAIRYPSLVDKLILADSYSEIPNAFWGALLKFGTLALRCLPIALSKRVILSAYHDQPYTRRILDKSFTIDRRTLAALKSAQFPAHTSQLAGIPAETLVIAGGDNRVGPESESGKIIYQQIPKARFAVIHDAFDPVTVMKKDIFNQMTINFLQGKALPHYPEVTYYTK